MMVKHRLFYNKPRVPHLARTTVDVAAVYTEAGSVLYNCASAVYTADSAV